MNTRLACSRASARPAPSVDSVALETRSPLGRSSRLGVALLALVLFALAPAASADRTDLSSWRGFNSATYFKVAYLDMRLCPSPMCGGVFVERVNRKRTKCADGARAEACYAAFVDFSRLGLSPSEQAALQAEFFAKRVLARGFLEIADSGLGIEVPRLVVTDAWQGVTGSQSDHGLYFGVVSTGIVCITHPCPIYSAFKLNFRHFGPLHGIDLSSSGATPEEIARGMEALSSGPGLIGLGRMRKIEGPAGRGRELVTSEFFTKVESGDTPRACGGFTYPPNPACMPGEFCEQPSGSCYIADLPGTCQEIPEACIEIYDPVCGCDGVTYPNDCHRQQAQVALDYEGACSPFPPEPCGATTCTGGTICCNPLQGICTPPGVACIQ